MTTATPTFEQEVEKAKEHFVGWTEDGTDFVPMARVDTDEGAVGVLLQGEVNGPVKWAALAEIAEHHTNPTRVVFISDIWYKAFDMNDPEVKNLKRPSEYDDKGEALAVYVITKEKVDVAVLPYLRDSLGNLMWLKQPDGNWEAEKKGTDLVRTKLA